MFKRPTHLVLRALMTRAACAVGVLMICMTLIGPVDADAQWPWSYQVGQPSTTGDPIPSISVKLPLTCSDGTQSIPNGGYLKRADPYTVTVDILTSNTGTCDAYFLGTYSSTEEHGVVKDWYWGWYPPATAGNPITYFAASPAPLTYDTRQPTTGQGSGTDNSLYQVGTFHVAFQGYSVNTGCNFQQLSNVVEHTINVLSCKPVWLLVGNPNQIEREAPGSVNFYIPPAMYAALSPAATDAVNAWNTALAGVVQFNIVQSDCSPAANCIRASEVSTLSGCTEIVPSGVNLTTGLLTAPEEMHFPTSPSTRDWRLRDYNRLVRSIAHELGHSVGLDHQDASCANADSIMTILSGPETDICNTMAVDPAMATLPTTNNVLPVNSSSYGIGPRVSCGF